MEITPSTGADTNPIGLTPQERERYDIIRACIDGDLTNAEAGARLGLTVRQTQRLKRAVEKNGERGVVHGNRGQTSNRANDPRVVSAIVAFLKQKKHRDFGPTFAQEQLAKQGIVMGVETLRMLMIGEGLWKPHKRRGPAIHREWRERKGMYGELVQFDGSYHDWFETGSEECLLGAIDDATGAVLRAVFEDNEGVYAVFRFWWAYVEVHGLPGAIYLDKFSTYKVNHKNATDNAEMVTQFERAMQELNVRVICANSPEAKGRIERLFGTLQDRLVKEMRLRDIKNRDDANMYFADEYLPGHNARFAIPARIEGDAHRPQTEELRKRLPAIFSAQSERNVNNDFTLRFKNQWFQLAAQQPVAVYRSDVVTIEERLDGSVHVRLKGAYLAYTVIAKHERAARPRVTALTKEKPCWKPPADHPWRKFKIGTKRKNPKILRNAR